MVDLVPSGTVVVDLVPNGTVVVDLVLHRPRVVFDLVQQDTVVRGR